MNKTECVHIVIIIVGVVLAMFPFVIQSALLAFCTPFSFSAMEEEPKKTKKLKKRATGSAQMNNDDETDYEALFAKAFYQ